MPRYEFELFADYHQFYLQDESADGNLGDAWTDEATKRLLAVAPGVVGIGTVRNMDVPVSVDILDSEPLLDLASFDHVVECSLSVNSGRIVVAGCTDYFPEASRIDVPVGTYRVRISYANLSSLSTDGLDGDDSYHLQLWPAATSGTSVVKCRAV